MKKPIIVVLFVLLAGSSYSQTVSPGVHTEESLRAYQLEQARQAALKRSKEQAERLQQEAARLREENARRLAEIQKAVASKNQATIDQINKEKELRSRQLPTEAEARAEAQLINAQNAKRQIDKLNELRRVETLEAQKKTDSGTKTTGAAQTRPNGELVFNPATGRYEAAAAENSATPSAEKPLKKQRDTEVIFNPVTGKYERVIVEQ